MLKADAGRKRYDGDCIHYRQDDFSGIVSGHQIGRPVVRNLIVVMQSHVVEEQVMLCHILSVGLAQLKLLLFKQMNSELQNFPLSHFHLLSCGCTRS